jgi:hypothetical protein
MIALSLLVALTHGYSLKEGVTPVQKVIQMLQEMSAKGAAEKAAEEKTFIQYKEFCNTEDASKTLAIKKGGEQIELLIADIQKAVSDSNVCAKKIMEENEEIAKLSAAEDESNAVSEKDRANYLKEHADYQESVDSLARGIQQLQSGSVPELIQGSNALQRDSRREALIQLQRISRIPLHAQRVLTSFLESTEDPDFAALNANAQAEASLAVSAPEADSYGFQSGGIVDMLKKLLGKFKDELNSLEREEMKRKGAQEVVIQDLKRQIAAATESKNYETATKAERDRTAAEKKGLLADTQKAKSDDEDYLSTLKAECAMAAEDFENRQQLRTEEMEAIEKATEILKSGSVTGMADKHLPGLMQRAFPLRGSKARTPRTTSNLEKFLESRAAQTGSKLLGLVAQKVGAAAKTKIPGFDPIQQVKKMMQDMIVNLMEQANEEATAKLWCDGELSTNKQTRDAKTDGVNELSTEKDKLNADIAKLSEEISELTKAIAEIDAAVAEATLTRGEEKETNKETVADAQEAQTAVSQALTVLKEFYRKAATATALVQGKAHKDEPEKNPFQEAYTGMGGENTGVVGMLEVIGSDFARLESETEAAEDQAAKEFERFSHASSEDRAVKNQEMQDRINLQVQKKASLTDTVGDLKAMQEELDSALLYYDKLKPSCVSAGDKYAERVQRREAEIQGLEEALKFFEGTDMPPMEE